MKELKEAAEEWMESCNPSKGNDWDKSETAYHSFLAGAEYIINNTQKTNESKNQET